MKTREWMQALKNKLPQGGWQQTLLLVCGLLGMLLLALSELMPERKVMENVQQAEPVAFPQGIDYAAKLERRLEELLSQMDGAGHTCVMVTLNTGETTVYATDSQHQTDGTLRTEHVLLGSGKTEALVESVSEPEILGVAVLCEGGADPLVVGRITAVVQALTNVGTNHITVARMAAAA